MALWRRSFSYFSLRSYNRSLNAHVPDFRQYFTLTLTDRSTKDLTLNLAGCINVV